MPELGGGFCGFPATQLWQDYWLWEKLLTEHPRLTAIIELGTAYGGCSLYLATQAHHRDMGFHTFDSIDHAAEPIDRLFGRPEQRPPVAPVAPYFQRVELILNGAAPEVVKLIDTQPVVLFCDNGHKAQEVALYAPKLHPGSVVVVHDWETEIFRSDIPDFLHEIYGDVCDEIHSMSRVFMRD